MFLCVTRPTRKVCGEPQQVSVMKESREVLWTVLGHANTTFASQAFRCRSYTYNRWKDFVADRTGGRIAISVSSMSSPSRLRSSHLQVLVSGPKRNEAQESTFVPVFGQFFSDETEIITEAIGEGVRRE